MQPAQGCPSGTQGGCSGDNAGRARTTSRRLARSTQTREEEQPMPERL